jgi:hypothetical protein
VAEKVQSLRGGEPLAPGLRAFFEPRYGHDFSRVRVHTEADAGQTARALNARAYTLGHEIAFAPGEYQPETREGRALLAHELTHVVQQSGQSRTVMRACACAAPSRAATSSEDSFLRSKFPNLTTGDYCVTGPTTPTYNCFAWSIGDTSRWLQSDVDSLYGNNNGNLEFSDFDAMYDAVAGLKPVTDSCPVDPEVALFGKGGKPTHAARKSSHACGGFESKLGRNVRIAHWVRDLEGGSVYGDINRFYVPK